MATEYDTSREHPLIARAVLAIREGDQHGARAVWNNLTRTERLRFELWLQDSDRMEKHIPGNNWERFLACVRNEAIL